LYKVVMNRDTPEESMASERNFCSKFSAILWVRQDMTSGSTLLKGIIDLNNTRRGRPDVTVDSPTLEIPEKLISFTPSLHHDRQKTGISMCVYLKVQRKYGPESLENWHRKNGCF
ncbi:hypothetical protein K438DRAFT_1509322, partial [Mycena galopus ATCC 62051]